MHDLAARYGDDTGALVLLSDWDKSGRLGADKRPGYRALLDAIEAGRCSALYSYSLSRLARSVPELSRLVATCNERNIPVRLYADHVDTATASGRLLTHVLASVAEFEADVASERVRAAIAAKVARGEPIGTVHRYGERDGEDAALVLAAFREAGSYAGAARLLNARGIKPRGSKRGWWPSAVAGVVARLDPQPVLHPHRQGAKAGGVSFVLAHLLRCPTCGTRLTGLRDRDGRRVRYVCRLGSVTPHPRMSITEGHLLPAVQAEVAHLRTPELVEQIERDRAVAAALEARRARVLDMYERGDIERTEYTRRLAAVTDALAALDAKRVVLAVPAIDWAWPPKPLNGVLSALFEEIALDPVSFQPTRFTWRVPEWRS